MIRGIGALIVAVAMVSGCATLPPGSDYPKTASTAFAQSDDTTLGRNLAMQSARHPGLSGFHLFPRGLDGLLLRTQLVRYAQRSLDVQYFLFVEDYTGKLLLDGVLRAADRGVRVRILIDDLNAFASPAARKTLAALDRHRNIEVRLFNPFAYRGPVSLLRRVEFVLSALRLNHRMHNKLLAVDGAIAIVGGRNVADEYFDAGAVSVRFGDFDVVAVGAVVPDLEKSFDEYWNCALSIPQEALFQPQPAATVHEARAELEENRAESEELARRLDGGDPLAGLLDGRVPLTWAAATMIADPPEKAAAKLTSGDGSPTATNIDALVEGVTRDLVVISPYFVPGPDGRDSLERLLRRGVRVRILTNSLASTDVPAVHGAYRRYRRALVDAGAEVFEVRPVPGTRGADRDSGGVGSGAGSGGSGAPFALHAKAYVFDGRKVLFGSANLDPRSLKLNTEIGLLIDSPEIAREVIRRFGVFASSARSYRVVLAPQSGARGMEWWTEVDGRRVYWCEEPDTTLWQRIKADLYALMIPLEGQL
jgi:cardiolipin synthase C